MIKKALRKIVVDTLWDHALRQVKAQNPTTIVITGSVGKTSAKDAILSVLSQGDVPVVHTQGNLNTEIGVPLSIMGYKEQPRGLWQWVAVLLNASFGKIVPLDKSYYILEFSADKPGDIGFLASKIKAEIACITQITPVHMAAYGSMDELIKEKQSIKLALKEGGTLIVNAMDNNQKNLLDTPGTFPYGIIDKIPKKEGVWFSKLHYVKNTIALDMTFHPHSNRSDLDISKSEQSEKLSTNLIGHHQVNALALAAAVGYKLGFKTEQIKVGLEKYQVPNGRGKLIQGGKETLIVDDTYNASPEAVKAGLDMLRDISDGRRVVAVLGNMNELGANAERLHTEVAEYAAKKVDYLVFVGPFEAKMRKAAEKAGLSPAKMIGFDAPEQAIARTEQYIHSKDLIYIKGSQNGVRLERMVKALMRNPKQAAELLVRQNWL